MPYRSFETIITPSFLPALLPLENMMKSGSGSGRYEPLSIEQDDKHGGDKEGVDVNDDDDDVGVDGQHEHNRGLSLRRRRDQKRSTNVYFCHNYFGYFYTPVGPNDPATLHNNTSNSNVRRTVRNFILMSILFGASHGCVVACLGLATARLGMIGAWQSGILFITYTVSALFLGVTYIVKKLGPRNALVLGMSMFIAYVGCFVGAIQSSTIRPAGSEEDEPNSLTDDDVDVHDDNDVDEMDTSHRGRNIAYLGAAIGGVGAAFLWTAQGAYFSQAAKVHAFYLKQQQREQQEQHQKEELELQQQREQYQDEGNESNHDKTWERHSTTTTASSSSPISTSTADTMTTTGSTASVEASTSYFAGLFAFWYLIEEVGLRLLSSILLEWHWASWRGIFGLYTAVTIISALAMLMCVENYDENDDYGSNEQNVGSNGTDETIVDDENINHNEYDTTATTTIPEDNVGSSSSSLPTLTTQTTKTTSSVSTESSFYKATAAAQLLIKDPKMKHMIGLNAVYGFASAFLNTHISSQVVPIALHDPDSKYLGVLTSWGSALAAIASLVFGRYRQGNNKSTKQDNNDKGSNDMSHFVDNEAENGGGEAEIGMEATNDDDNNSKEVSNHSTSIHIMNGRILVGGAMCFFCVAIPFVIVPAYDSYGWISLFMIYSLHGIGRATFEGALKATFANYFDDKEAAFANIIVQNGSAATVGYFVSFGIPCDKPSTYCMTYKDGSLQYVLVFEMIVIASAILAIVGYYHSSYLFEQELRQRKRQPRK